MQEDLTNSEGNEEVRMDVYGRAVKGGAWLIALRVFMAVLNAVRLPIVLRLLAPYDFGLLRIGTLLTGVAGSVTNLGLKTALVQRKDDDPGHLNVVWTVNVVRGVLIATFLCLIAPYAAVFFDGSGRFKEGDLLRPAAFVERLQRDDDALSAYLVSRFSASTRQMLDEYEPAANVLPALKTRLIDELNGVARAEAIYDKDRFAGVKLSKYSLRLALAPQPDRDNVKFNRLLLEEAFDGIIKRDILDRWTATLVIQMLAICVFLSSLRNVGTIYFTKDLDFKKQVILQIASSVVNFAVTVSLAFVCRNVWALVFGRLAEMVAGCVLSYVMHPYRPRLCFNVSKAKELWGFGKHIFGIAILKYLCLNGDDIVLGRMLGTAALGFYQQAFRIGGMVATEIGNKISTVSFPAFAKIQGNMLKLQNGYLKSIRLTSMAVLPAAGGLIALAPEITLVVFGARWLPMVPAMQVLCLMGPLQCMQRAPIFMAVGRPDIITKLSLIRLVFIAATVYPLTLKWGMAGTAACVLGAGLVIQPVASYELRKLIGSRTRDVLMALAYPSISTLIMMLCTYVAKNAMAPVQAVSLIALVGLGAAVYLVLLLLLSKISPEYDAFAPVRDVLRGLK